MLLEVRSLKSAGGLFQRFINFVFREKPFQRNVECNRNTSKIHVVRFELVGLFFMTLAKANICSNPKNAHPQYSTLFSDIDQFSPTLSIVFRS